MPTNHSRLVSTVAFACAIPLMTSVSPPRAAFAQAPPAWPPGPIWPSAGEVSVPHAVPETPTRFTVGAFYGSGWPHGNGYKWVNSGDAVSSLGLTAGVDLRPGRRMVLAPYAEWQREQSSGSWHGTNDTQLEVDSVGAGLALRWVVRPWLQPFVTAGAGWSQGRVAFALEDGRQLRDDAASWFGRAGGGVTFKTQALGETHGARLSLSASIEGGYIVAQDMAFTFQPPSRALSTQLVPTTSVGIGDIARSRPYLRLGVALHF